MEENGIRIYLDPGLSEDAAYEVTRQIKMLDGVLTVTLDSKEPHFGLVVLRNGASPDAIIGAVRDIEGVKRVETPRRAA